MVEQTLGKLETIQIARRSRSRILRFLVVADARERVERRPSRTGRVRVRALVQQEVGESEVRVDDGDNEHGVAERADLRSRWILGA
jgi:hypothetical protein